MNFDEWFDTTYYQDYYGDEKYEELRRYSKHAYNKALIDIMEYCGNHLKSIDRELLFDYIEQLKANG